MDTEVVRVEVSKLELKAGDILVVKSDRFTEGEMSGLAEFLPEGTSLWFAPLDMQLEVVREKEAQ